MTGFNYDRTAATAAKLLTKFGGDVTLVSLTVPAYNPATGSAAPMPTNSTRQGVLLDFGTGQTKASGGLIQQKDKRLLLEPGVVPALEDQVIVQGQTYVIKGLGEVKPGATPVLYDLHVRA